MVESLLPPGQNDREQDYLNAAETAVRAYCGWHVAPVITEDIVIDGSGSHHVLIPSLKVVDITAAKNGGTELDPLDLEWSEAGMVRVPGRWTARLRGVRMTVTHGFAEVPDVAEIVRAIAARASSAPAGITREQAGQVSLSFSSTAPGVSGGAVLMDHERLMLDRYRLFGRF